MIAHNPCYDKGEVRPAEDFVSARSAAKMLRVDNRTLDKLAQIHGLTTRQIPGNNRKWLLRADIVRLLESAVSKTVVTS